MDDEKQDTKMQFQEERRMPTTAAYTPPGLKGWLIQHSGGLVATERQATLVLVGVIVIAVSLSLWLFFGGEDTTPIEFVPEAEAPVTDVIPPRP